MRKLLAAAVPILILAALLAGCGGGTTTRVIERTVTERVEAPAKGGGKKKVAAKESTESKSAGEGEAVQPKRIVHLKHFRTPSGNIGCVMSGAGARCDIRKRDWAPPPRPASCSKEVDYGQGLQVGHEGQASFVCAGDTALEPGLSSLYYGTAARVGSLECISRSEGVTCVNQVGHGFFISVQSYQVF
jgi:hypothetical protein